MKKEIPRRYVLNAVGFIKSTCSYCHDYTEDQVLKVN